jgi:hypothetical protein
MTTRELTVTLPETLAEEAEATGLLRNSELERILREELRRRRVDELFQLADDMASLDLPPMSLEEVQAEIDEARRDRDDRNGDRSTPAYRLPYDQWVKHFDAWLASRQSRNPDVDDSRDSIYR